MFFVAYRIPLIIGGIMMAIASFWTWLSVHDYNLKQQIIAEFNHQQEQLVAQKEAEFRKQMEELGSEAENLRKEIEAKNKDINTLTDGIEKNLTSKGGNDAAAQYLKEVVSKMRSNFGEKSK